MLSVSPFLSAQENLQSKDYFTIKSEAVTLTAMEAGHDAVPAEPAGFSSRGAEKAAGGIANAGLAAWNVINSGAPSAGYASGAASPAGKAPRKWFTTTR